MEFTPKSHESKSSARPKPYVSQSTGGYGRNNVRKDTIGFRRVTSAHSTPHRYHHKPYKSRTDKIMENSSIRADKDEPTKLNTWLTKKGPSPKRPLAPSNSQAKKKKEADPYNVFSEDDTDDEIFLSAKKTINSTEGVNSMQKKAGVKPSGLFANKEAKKSLFPTKESPKKESPKFNFYSNKENDIFGSPVKSTKPYNFKTYGSAKRKPFFSKNTHLNGVSPVKVERLYGEQEVGGSLWSTDANEKENIPETSESNKSHYFDSAVTQPHLIGFPNYGNTCYLNAVIQSLLALPSFTLDLKHLTSSLSPDRTSLFHSLGQILQHRDKLQLKDVKTKLKSFKENIVRVDDSFSGFKMQDANEFLTLVLDTIKDEVERCHMTTPSPDHPSTSTERLNLTPEHPGTEQTQCYEPISENELSNRLDDPFDSDLFGPTNENENSDSFKNNNYISQKSNGRNSSTEHSDFDKNERTREGREIKKGSEDFNVNKSSFSSPLKETCPKVCNSDRVISLDSISSPKTKVSEYSSENMQITTPKDKSIVSVERIPRNPVKDNFEFQLMESYRCLSCSEVIGRNQEYFGLYVNLPEKESSDSSFDEDIKLNGEGLTTIQDAIDAYMKEEEREINCEKCGHDKAEVVTSLTSLPRILVVQLKRYEYKPEMLESLKVSSRVSINQWIDLDKFTSDDVKPVKSCSTDCSSIVPKAPKQATLTVRNLASELNVLEKKEETIENYTNENTNASPVKDPFKSPIKNPDVITLPSPDQEDEELQEVMRRSMADMGGPGTSQSVPNQEEDEIQQAIRLSLQDFGMSFSVENEESRDGFEKTTKEGKDIDIADNRHTYRLMSIISHFGLTTKTGHYVSDVYNVKENSWFHYDDETVTPITESVVTAGGRQKNGYIFFYIHRDFFEQLQKSEDKGR